ncbi:unnamed protein product, partial [Ectocarpus sp. 13 AM-2016]
MHWRSVDICGMCTRRALTPPRNAKHAHYPRLYSVSCQADPNPRGVGGERNGPRRTGTTINTMLVRTEPSFGTADEYVAESRNTTPPSKTSKRIRSWTTTPHTKAFPETRPKTHTPLFPFSL